MLRNLRVLGPAAIAACLLVGWPGTGPAGAQSPCDDLGGMIQADGVCHVHTETTTYKVDFKFPVDYPDLPAVTDYLTQRRDDFVGFVTTLPDRPGLPYELEVRGNTYRSGTAPSGTESLVFEEYNESGGAHPTHSYKAFNYDLSKNVPITFGTLFIQGSKPLDVIYPFVRRELEQRFGPEQMHGGLDVKTYQNFAITDDAVIFFFHQGLVLAQVDGPIEISVPRTELASLLAY